MNDTRETKTETSHQEAPAPKKMTPERGITAMSGMDHPAKSTKDANVPANFNIMKASNFSPEVTAELKRQGLDIPQTILEDNTGKNAERLTQIVVAHQGLPDGQGNFQTFKEVVPGQYNETGNGIDLLGITSDGKPVPVEVKKRENSNRDSLGSDGVKNLNPETMELLSNIQLERRNNPVLLKDQTHRKAGEPDNEISSDQMSDLWLRDRWISLVKNRKEFLEGAGVSPEYLDVSVLAAHPYSEVWKQLLENKHTVIVSSQKNWTSNRLFNEAVFQKGFNVSVIDLTA